VIIMKKAMYYTSEKKNVICLLCPHKCEIADNHTGRCKVRKNIGVELFAENYSKVSSIGVDPIEKKPLFHWRENSKILSFGSYGCNFSCAFCQNYAISMEKPKTHIIKPEEIIELALQYNTPSIAYTYNEPTVFYEMMFETAVVAKEKNIDNVIVTNGFINKEPLLNILPYIDAMNIDLKTYSDENYKKLGGISVQHILDTIAIANEHCHLEVTMLMVPKIMDDCEEFENLLIRLKQAAPKIVIHLSRYFPRYNYNEPATDILLMQKFKETANRYFEKVYLGNVR